MYNFYRMIKKYKNREKKEEKKIITKIVTKSCTNILLKK